MRLSATTRPRFLEAGAEPRADVGEAPVLAAGAGVREMLDRRHHAPVLRQPVAERARLAKQRRAAERAAVDRDERRVRLRVAVVDRAAEARLDEDALRDVDRPGQAAIGEARVAAEVEAAAEMGARNEIAREEVRRRERLREQDLGRGIGGALLRAPRILGRDADAQ